MKLPDYLALNLRVLICGTAAGTTSASIGHYYAGAGNLFWTYLYRAGITTEPLFPSTDSRVLEFGVGLTDLAKKVAASSDRGLRAHYDVEGFVLKIERHRPAWVAFHGKEAAKEVSKAFWTSPALVDMSTKAGEVHFCENRVPAELRDEVRVDYVVRGNAVTIRELRPPWREEFGPEWSVNPCAQLRLDPATGLWTLYWPDRNSRWHVYAGARPTREVEWLLREIDLDPHGAFWG